MTSATPTKTVIQPPSNQIVSSDRRTLAMPADIACLGCHGSFAFLGQAPCISVRRCTGSSPPACRLLGLRDATVATMTNTTKAEIPSERVARLREYLQKVVDAGYFAGVTSCIVQRGNVLQRDAY